ncbi:MAG: hypothetical protein MZV70_77235 [Desulfobacterales bacterium]|nr:hypothetical protein [Desulfobacterales bacterium]
MKIVLINLGNEPFTVKEGRPHRPAGPTQPGLLWTVSSRNLQKCPRNHARGAPGVRRTPGSENDAASRLLLISEVIIHIKPVREKIPDLSLFSRIREDLPLETGKARKRRYPVEDRLAGRFDQGCARIAMAEVGRRDVY